VSNEKTDQSNEMAWEPVGGKYHAIEGVNIFVRIHRTPKGDFTCMLSETKKCQFLGFRKFGQVPVCMKGEQHDLNFINDDPFDNIRHDCGLAEMHSVETRKAE
jgi:hypothetical protein